MRKSIKTIVFGTLWAASYCLPGAAAEPLANWKSAAPDFVLKPGPPGSWDEHIRERMWVLYEDGIFRAWYAGWQGPYDLERPNLVHLGYATSKDGIHWTKHPSNPIFSKRWTEDMCIVKSDGLYYMFVEDESHDATVIHLMTSKDGLLWEEHGDVLKGIEGSNWEGGWVGTPIVWKEGKKWIMLYEGGPPGDIALATSGDGRNWKRSDANPVLTEGVGWESKVTAPDAIIQENGEYVLYYHALGDDKKWRSGAAVSKDLIHWERYSGNPIFENPSPVIVQAGGKTFCYVTYEQHNGVNGILAYVRDDTKPLTK
jgi:predicted GH43/DUF377 family glycosyl hydrolase